MGSTQILDLLAHIYGPYPEHMILKPEFPRPGVKLLINDLQLNFQGDPKISGFDETEYITNPPTNSRIAVNSDVVFFGVIEIDDLDWLSEQGLHFLERDFKDFDKKIHMEHRQSNSTIKKAYMQRRQDWPRLKVKICCRKTLLAHYMTSKNDYDKLLIYSQFEQKKRTYWVRSMHVATLNSSLKFMTRYRLRAMITELIETDPDHTVLEERNADWIIRRYFETIRPRDRDLRLFLEEDHEYAPRHLRHLPRADIRGYLAEHAEWLLAHMIARKQGSAKLLDIHQWISFCKEARKDSIAAAKEGIKWGASRQVADGSYNLARNLARFGETERFWANQLKIIQQKKSKQAQKPRELSPEIELAQITVPQVIHFQYDSDFSEASTVDSSESESDSDSGPTPKIPGFCFETPQIPSGRFVWNCPGCSYHIDFLNLVPENLEALPDDTIRVLTSKAWKVSDKPIQRALFRMVSNHYEVQHLNQRGLRVTQTPAGEWMVRKSKAPRPQPKEKTAAVKMEEQSQPLRRSSRMPRPRRNPD